MCARHCRKCWVHLRKAGGRAPGPYGRFAEEIEVPSKRRGCVWYRIVMVRDLRDEGDHPWMQSEG